MADREGERHDIAIEGKLRTSTGKRDVTIVDLSERGCRIYDRMGYLVSDMAVTLRIGPIGPVEATVRWQQRPHAGLHFTNPLYPAVLDHIRAHFDLRHLGSGGIDEPGKGNS
ncbi:PilZ domain-containing protein [Aurantiacibacter poecillastricola]|uniref:PilZ domain-containing protein n=1 Tax=Aurantiacibacter poecillastricola TaxID=3064385 RepID=UPI00273EC7B9|nr:PilZ domain-containing protein [Aurantiacibacter sp. 219JJ12-13]MDP5261819.1 PilZ domain-containing protein [Aurantiacibacter sp. 219JJ12-13]